MYIFLDESGQFAKHDHEEYFVVGTFTVGDQRRTDKAMRSWFRTRFPRKMRRQSEIKWSATGISDGLRSRTVKHIAKLDVRIRYGFLLRKNIPGAYRRKGKIKDGALYTSIIGEILKKYIPTDEKEIHIFCDTRSLKGVMSVRGCWTSAEFRGSPTSAGQRSDLPTPRRISKMMFNVSSNIGQNPHSKFGRTASKEGLELSTLDGVLKGRVS